MLCDESAGPSLAEAEALAADLLGTPKAPGSSEPARPLVSGLADSKGLPLLDLDAPDLSSTAPLQPEPEPPPALPVVGDEPSPGGPIFRELELPSASPTLAEADSALADPFFGNVPLAAPVRDEADVPMAAPVDSDVPMAAPVRDEADVPMAAPVEGEAPLAAAVEVDDEEERRSGFSPEIAAAEEAYWRENAHSVRRYYIPTTSPWFTLAVSLGALGILMTAIYYLLMILEIVPSNWSR